MPGVLTYSYENQAASQQTVKIPQCSKKDVQAF